MEQQQARPKAEDNAELTPIKSHLTSTPVQKGAAVGVAP